MSTPGEWAVLNGLQCPAGGLCACRHDCADQKFRCLHCGCDCPLPEDGDALSGDPDGCPCCHRDVFASPL